MGVVYHNHTPQSTPLIIKSVAHGSPALRCGYQVGTLRGWSRQKPRITLWPLVAVEVELAEGWWEDSKRNQSVSSEQ